MPRMNWSNVVPQSSRLYGTFQVDVLRVGLLRFCVQESSLEWYLALGVISQYLTQPSDRKLAGITKVFLSGNASLMELNLSGIEEARALNQIRTDPGGTLSQLASVVLVNLCDVGARFLPCRR